MGLDEAATGLDGLETLPGAPSQPVGELFDEPRPAGGIEHPADMRLF
ncbi:Uncharacterised protein [Mycobacterium tuberculosis]|uniref:Uncharacterized protein n=1 Tax=Mycobacterium tuberculosis TaxID=1773 RepID=A0A655FYL6_MYCTX|nr:Uncharacterised protein [Mycobacterium tuberculosis]CNW13965.1 Uncharacterised protein [Mycobacterium tuberculosis]CNW21660.1 Uncharacterised protein [Mycobacterium tuberculosis]CNW44814.1 Uncharacterised protein [Mycobacterium tuberculosis]CNW83263.1 Uncharacterised protein [Mycobacterium tuberculosis]